MFSSSTPLFADAFLLHSTNIRASERFKTSQKKVKLKAHDNFTCIAHSATPSTLSSFSTAALYKSIPLAASIAILLWSNPAGAGILSGSTGLESMPGPQLPQMDFLNRWNDENQKKYAEFDSRFKSSQVLKDLLEKSKLNKEKNRQAILDKYCVRGAEWGVGDCSTQGMTEEDKESFISMLKKKAGTE
ncbi:hypothetical protein AAC387_Pa02g1546 [Persea americana]|eukprot:TRINITY_DN20613_c0_g2_i1.p1 TRINITY_DN20613_c0_g2~~TRINITY_DN20613_c0_g2_i1.p1  ORF type:complete len:188 (-),score=52.65 TRINITY_DN20613_c0_g2_i1:199-762(-)